MSNKKSNSVNRCVFTLKTFLPNFTHIRFETREPLAFSIGLKSGRPKQEEEQDK